MKRLSMLALVVLLLGLASGRLPAGQPGVKSRPSLALLSLKEEGRKNLGDVSETMNMLVSYAFGDAGGFRLVDPAQTAAEFQAVRAQGQETDPRALAALGGRLGARFLLTGSYLPEYNAASDTVTMTVTLRMVDAADGSVFRNFQEVGSGPSLGSVVGSLSRQLSAKAAAAAKAAPAAPARAPVTAATAAAVAAKAPEAAVAAVPVQAPKTAVADAPARPAGTALAALAAAAAAPAPAAVVAAAPEPPAAAAAVPAPATVVTAEPEPAAAAEPAVAAVAAPEPAAAPAPAVPRAAPKALLVLREGKINGIYYPNGGLSQFGAKIGDFDFLVKSLARLFPADAVVTYDRGSNGDAGDPVLNKALEAKYHPDVIVVLALECRTQTESRMLLLSRTLVQAIANIEFLAPGTPGVLASKTVQTDYFPAKGMRNAFPPELKDQLAKGIAAALPALPY